MSIRISNIMSSYDVCGVKRNTQSVRLTRAEEKKDMVALSTQAKDYQTVTQVLKNVSDVRLEKVAEIQEKMDNGYYTVTSLDVADKIIANSEYLF